VGLESLLYIINLNQPEIFLNLSFWFWMYLAVVMAFWYDLHFKNPGALARAKARHESVNHWLRRALRVWSSAFWDRIEHFRRWRYFKHWQNYLILPGLTFWATAAMLYLDFGQKGTQQVFVVLSSAALITTFLYLKEIFRRRKDEVDSDAFVALSVVKIYTAGLLFGAGLAITRRFCLGEWLYAALVLCLTFLLVYQALFQHAFIRLFTIGVALLIAAAMAIIAYFVYIYWGYNFYTAAIFMAAFYNLFWGVFHYYLDHALTQRVFWEIFAVSLLVAAMVIQATNFRARLLDSCF